MSTENRFEKRYQTGDTPWDHGMPDTDLVGIITRQVSGGKVLDVGCGTGENAIWLAKRGFVVSGCDISETAIEKAREKAAQSGVDCSFLVADFLSSHIPSLPFDLVFDRGCLHSFDADRDRERFAENVAFHLAEGGLWLNLSGNADEGPRQIGPPQLTAGQLVAAVEPAFEILSLTTGHFGSDQTDPPRAWVCLMRKRAAATRNGVQV